MSSSPPAELRRYLSLMAIGRGGMGTVEVALERGPAAAARIVALKRQLPEVRDATQIEMFLREARVATLLDHPNVVRAYDFGERDGELYLSMEYVQGESLAEVLAKGGPLEPALAAFVLAEACEGLHAAHELRDAFGHPLALVHRDISPQNIMVSYDGAVKVVDFGVAKIAARSASPLTRTGEVKGKIAYMSPEQAMAEPLDRRSDLYAVGAVLYEAVTGKRMWGEGSDMQMLRRFALEEPPPLLADAAPALRALHARLVAKSRDQRPSTARDVLLELRAFIRDSGRLGDSAVLRARMDQLFAAAMNDKRARLAEAITRVAREEGLALPSPPQPRAAPAPSRPRAAAEIRRAPPASVLRRWAGPGAVGIFIVAAVTLLALGARKDDRPAPAGLVPAAASPPLPSTLRVPLTPPTDEASATVTPPERAHPKRRTDGATPSAKPPHVDPDPIP